MKTKARSIITPHRFARLLRWAQAMLAWIALALFSNPARIDRRRIRRRYRFLRLHRIERFVHMLVLMRAVEIAGVANRRAGRGRNAAPAGFRRRVERGLRLRAAIGARLRKALRHSDVAVHLQRLMAALADIDAFTRRFYLRRARQGLSRLYAVVMSAPPAARVASLAAPEPCAADSS